MQLKEILQKLQNGDISIDETIGMLGSDMEQNLVFARVDTDRKRRRGLPEVIFGPGKTPEQVVEIMHTLKAAGQSVLATRVTDEIYVAVKRAHPEAVYHEAARCITMQVEDPPAQVGQVAVVTAGTADIPVAEEAAITAEHMGAKVVRIYDVGVAGLHRVINHLDTLKSSRVVVVAAGMEGALPSVVGGLIDKPIIAVPTSVGYSLNLKGMTALLAMLNTCVPGITVVNVDNGFGAGVAAGLINRVAEQ